MVFGKGITMMQNNLNDEEKPSFNQPLKIEKGSLFMEEPHDLNWYRECVLIGFGDLEWFKNHKKELYSVKDIENYAFSVFAGLEDSLTADSKLSLEKQIRRVMRSNFKLARNEKSFKYCLGQAEVMFLVNTLMKDYLNNLIYPEIKDNMFYDAVVNFYKLAYGENWVHALKRDISNAKNKDVANK